MTALSEQLQLCGARLAVPNHLMVSSFLTIRLPRAHSRRSNEHATHSSIVHKVSNMWLLHLNATAEPRYDPTIVVCGFTGTA